MRRGQRDKAFSSQTVVVCYPAPIALAYRRFYACSQPGERLARLFLATEATLRYLVSVAICDIFRAQVEEEDGAQDLLGHRAFTFLHQRTNMSFGMWCEALGEAARALDCLQNRFVPALSRECRPEGPLLGAVSELVRARNELLGHPEGNIPLSDDEARDAIGELRPSLEQILQDVGFVCDYPLGFVQEVRLPSDSRREPGDPTGLYRFHSCMGTHPARTREAYVQEVSAPLRDGLPLIASPDGSRTMYLWPLLMQRRSDTSARHTLYVFERLKKPYGWLSHIRAHAIEGRQPWEEDLGSGEKLDHQQLVELLRVLPPVVNLPEGVDAAKRLGRKHGDDLVGHTLGNYRLEAVIGAGGFATVYSAASRSGERVAIKVIDSKEQRDVDVERFEREFRQLRQAEHPGIVECYDEGKSTVGGTLYLWYAMAFAFGGDLSEALAARSPAPEGKMPWLDARLRPEVVRQFCAIARAVAWLHSCRVVHRDIKPGNVLIDEHGETKLSDFGLAKALGPSDLTSDGAVLGTRAYMAPEQARGEKEKVTAAADVYALGVLLAEMATGRTPKPNMEVPQGSTLNDWAPLRRLPNPVRRLLLRWTDISVKHRPEDASRLAEELAKAVCDSTPVPHEGAPEPLPSTTAATEGDEAPPVGDGTGVSPIDDGAVARLVLKATALVIVLVALAAGVFFWTGLRTPSSPEGARQETALGIRSCYSSRPDVLLVEGPATPLWRGAASVRDDRVDLLLSYRSSQDAAGGNEGKTARWLTEHLRNRRQEVASRGVIEVAGMPDALVLVPAPEGGPVALVQTRNRGVHLLRIDGEAQVFPARPTAVLGEKGSELAGATWLSGEDALGLLLRRASFEGRLTYSRWKLDGTRVGGELELTKEAQPQAGFAADSGRVVACWSQRHPSSEKGEGRLNAIHFALLAEDGRVLLPPAPIDDQPLGYARQPRCVLHGTRLAVVWLVGKATGSSHGRVYFGTFDTSTGRRPAPVRIGGFQHPTLRARETAIGFDDVDLLRDGDAYVALLGGFLVRFDERGNLLAPELAVGASRLAATVGREILVMAEARDSSPSGSSMQLTLRSIRCR